jgi:hypothetical protein
MTRVLPSSRSTHTEARVESASHYLKRCYVAERQLLRTMAAWFVDTSQWDLKRQLANDMWEASRHADALRTRVLQLRYPRRDVDKKYDQHVMDFIATSAKAQSSEEFVAGIYGVVIPELNRACKDYLEQTDPLDDAPTVHSLRHIIYDLERQVDRMRALIIQISPTLFEDRR